MDTKKSTPEHKWKQKLTKTNLKLTNKRTKNNPEKKGKNRQPKYK